MSGAATSTCAAAATRRFGSGSFDSFAYGTGATMQRLVSRARPPTGITAVSGRVLGDESYFDGLRGTAPYGYQTAYRHRRSR